MSLSETSSRHRQLANYEGPVLLPVLRHNSNTHLDELPSNDKICN